jgi:hypothetical protein
MALLRAEHAIIESPLPSPPNLLADLASDPERRRAMGQRAQAVWSASRGTLARVEALLKTWRP